MPYALLFAVPFFFSGLLLGSILAHPRLSSTKMYCWDLIGSACGALLVIPLISHWGVETALLGFELLLLGVVAVVFRPAELRNRAVIVVAGLTAAVCHAVSRGIDAGKVVYRSGQVCNRKYVLGSRSPDRNFPRSAYVTF
jgi:hypothetical protein